MVSAYLGIVENLNSVAIVVCIQNQLSAIPGEAECLGNLEGGGIHPVFVSAQVIGVGTLATDPMV